MFALRAAPRIRTSQAFPSVRSFHATRTTLAGKESALHEDQNERAAKIEEHKQAQLKDAKANQGKWRDELASDSESAVKADRNDLKDAKDDIGELQKETAKQAERDRK